MERYWMDDQSYSRQLTYYAVLDRNVGSGSGEELAICRDPEIAQKIVDLLNAEHERTRPFTARAHALGTKINAMYDPGDGE